MHIFQSKAFRLVGLYLLVGMFFTFVNPDKLPVIGLLAPFLIVFLALYATAKLLLETFFELELGPRRIIALSVSLLPTLLLVIQSITQLTLRDVILVIAIVVVMVWYTTKVSQKV